MHNPLNTQILEVVQFILDYQEQAYSRKNLLKSITDAFPNVQFRTCRHSMEFSYNARLPYARRFNPLHSIPSYRFHSGIFDSEDCPACSVINAKSILLSIDGVFRIAIDFTLETDVSMAGTTYVEYTEEPSHISYDLLDDSGSLALLKSSERLVTKGFAFWKYQRQETITKVASKFISCNKRESHPTVSYDNSFITL